MADIVPETEQGIGIPMDVEFIKGIVPLGFGIPLDAHGDRDGQGGIIPFVLQEITGDVTGPFGDQNSQGGIGDGQVEMQPTIDQVIGEEIDIHVGDDGTGRIRMVPRGTVDCPQDGKWGVVTTDFL